MTNFINVRRTPIGARVLYRGQLWIIDASYGDGEHCLVRPDGQEVHAYPDEFTRLGIPRSDEPAPQSRETAERELDALREQRRPIPEEEGPDWARLWSDTSAELR